MEEEKPSYYAIIPAEVRYNKNLRPNEKLLFGEITALSSFKGECTASNNYFSRLYGVVPSAITKWIKDLEKEQYITVDYIREGKEIKKRIIRLTGIHKYDKVFTNVVEGYSQKVKENNTSINNNINNNIVDEYEKEIGLLTPYQYERLITYTVDLSPEMIIEAIHIASRMNKKNLAYVEAILKNWIQNGYKVIGDIKNNKPIKETKKFENDTKSSNLADLYDN